jgi:hypothetical protein
MRKRDKNGKFIKGKTFSKECIVCGKKFHFTRTKRLNTSKFCSQKCHYLFGQTLETIKKISDSGKGSKNHFYGKKHTKETREKIKIARSKQVFSEDSKRRQIEALDRNRKCGEEHYNWKGGITPIQFKIRNSKEYKLWRTAVFERDNYTCIWCNARNGNGKAVILNADHIKPFAYFPELRFAIDNGRTLCINCHKTTDNFAGKGYKRK